MGNDRGFWRQFPGATGCLFFCLLATGYGATPQLVLGAEPKAFDWALFAPFLREGFRHILTGFDHLLFIAGLMMAAKKIRQIAALVTAFTVAHSLTLGVSVAGWVDVPPRLVEGGIALTILWVAIDNLWRSRTPRAGNGAEARHPGLRWWVVFLFGLCHGFGFSSAVKMMLPLAGPAVPLLGFNLGVELGQIVFVALVGPLWLWGKRTGAWPATTRILSLLMAAVSIFWFILRVSGA